MKKLKKLELKDEVQLLNGQDMKLVLGGFVSDTGTCGWSGGTVGSVEDGVATVTFYYPKCNISKADAMSYYNNYGGHWCCDHCSTSSYCGNG